MLSDLVTAMWLTVNRKCNFRCLWCYAEGSNYRANDEMSLEKAIGLVRLGTDVGAGKVVILGGEPTLWSHLPALIRKINEEKPEIIPVIVTNGLLFSNDTFRKKFQGLKYSVGLSLKAGNEEQYQALTKTNSFHRVKKAIGILATEGRLNGVSITIVNRMIDNLVEMAQVVADAGGKSVSFEMCAPSFDANGNPSGAYLVPPKVLADRIVRDYPKLDEIMKGRVYFQMSVPFCLFPEGFIQNLVEKNQIVSGCHVLSRSGLIFNPEGGVLLCNCLYHLPIGFWGEDFQDAASFSEWWQRKEVEDLNSRLINYPAKKCKTCEQYGYCGGGCSLQWFHFNPEETL